MTKKSLGLADATALLVINLQASSSKSASSYISCDYSSLTSHRLGQHKSDQDNGKNISREVQDT